MEKMMAIEAELARPETSHSARGKRVSLVVPPSPPAKEHTKTFPSRPNPLRINPAEEARPMTSSSRRLSFSSMSTSRRPIKYGTGKYARVELVPQPSDDDDDPLVGDGCRELSWGVPLADLTASPELADVEEGA